MIIVFSKKIEYKFKYGLKAGKITKAQEAKKIAFGGASALQRRYASSRDFNRQAAQKDEQAQKKDHSLEGIRKLF